MSTLPALVLKSGRDKSVRERHPRLFASAIKHIEGKPKDGDPVDVIDNKGEWLARGIINQQAQIAVRLMTWDAQETLDDALLQQRMSAAIQRRLRDPLLKATNARRLIFGESDFLPGIIADDYAGHIVLELSTLGAVRKDLVLIDALRTLLGPRTIIVRGDDERLRNEYGGSVPSAVREALTSQAPDEPIEIWERGLRFLVNLAGGQKTGFYLDQRENRAHVGSYCAGATLLNMFSYTGAFAVHALAGGAAQAINVDSSAAALALAERNIAQAPGEGKSTYVVADAFDDLRARRARAEQFDAVILDPPKFAHNLLQIERASRAYWDLNRLGLTLVKPGGILATFSCSGVVDRGLLQKILFSASLEAGRDAQIIEHLSQASDHPVLLTFPESEYLKGFIVRVD